MEEKNNFSRRDFVHASVKGAMGVTAFAYLPTTSYAEAGEKKQAQHNKKMPSEDQVILINDHKSDWHIAPFSETKAIRFACDELQKYLLQISGVKLPVEKDVSYAFNIIVGLRNDLPPKYKSLLPSPKGGHDGYSLVISKSPAIIIAGDNEQGAIYGVYDLLERIGCRWFYPMQDLHDPEVVPELTTVSVPVTSFAIASPVKYRICNGDAWYWDIDYNTAIKQIDWGMKNRYNMMGWQGATSFSRRSLLQQYKDFEDAGIITELEKRGMSVQGPAHSFDQFLRSDQYFDQHPEWFGMRNGKRVPQAPLTGAQFCWSNREARKQFINNAISFIAQAPLIHIFLTIPFDGGVACDCDKCRKMGASNLLMILVDELIERLSISSPGVKVAIIGGYGPVKDPPSDLSIINPKMRIGWAQWGRNHEIGYSDPRYNKDNLEKWRKAAKGGMTIVQYYTDNFSEPWVMGPFTLAMESDRRYFIKNHIDGLYMLIYPPGYWWNHALNGYIAGRVFYDASLVPVEEIKDYASHYFGKEAGPLLAAYYTEWANHIGLSYHIRGGAKQKDHDMLASERRKWIDPAIKVTKNDKIYGYRVGKVAKLHALAEKLVDAQLLHTRIKSLRKEGKFKQTEVMLNKARIKTDKVMFMFYSIAGLNQGLIDIKEVPGFIKLAVKGWIDEEAKLIAARDRSAKN